MNVFDDAILLKRSQNVSKIDSVVIPRQSVTLLRSLGSHNVGVDDHLGPFSYSPTCAQRPFLRRPIKTQNRTLVSFLTSPKTTCLPFSQPVSIVQRKNLKTRLVSWSSRSWCLLTAVCVGSCISHAQDPWSSMTI